MSRDLSAFISEVVHRVAGYGEGVGRPHQSGIATFFGADPVSDPAGVDLGLIGLPTDVGAHQRPGARYGPRAVRDASRMLRYQNVATDVIPYDLGRVADLGDPDLDLFGLEGIVEQIEAHYRTVVGAGVVPLTVGGDHSVTLPILRAVAAPGPVALVHFDAHYDTAGAMRGSAVHHGATVLNAVAEGLVDPERSIQVGIRDPWAEIERLSHPPGLTSLGIEETAELGPAGVAARIREVVGDARVYVSFDVDVLDPTMAPGTGTPVPGGLLPREALATLRRLRGLDVVGADVVEVSPPWDPAGMTALTAAQVLFDLLCLAAEAHAAR
jgi:guanidinopropionase